MAGAYGARMRLPLFLCALSLVSLSAGLAKDLPARNAEGVTAAIAAARPGDSIVMQRADWKDVEILFEANGTPEQPITLRAETPGKVVLSGKSRLRIAGRHLVVDGLVFQQAWHTADLIEFRRDSKRLAADCRLTNCAVVACNGPDASAETRWISLYGERNRVDHCWIEGKTTKGTTLVVWLGETPNSHRIERNHFGPRQRLGKNGGETIRVGDSKTSMSISQTTVRENCFEECNGEAEIISNKSCENLYTANTFVRCSGSLTLRHGNRCIVEGNFFLGEEAAGTGGVRVIGEGHRVFNNYFADLRGKDVRGALVLVNGQRDSPLNGYFPVRHATIAFNTFINCREVFVIGQADPDAGNDVPPSNCTIANNLIFRGKKLVVGDTKDLKCAGNLGREIAVFGEGFAAGGMPLQQDRQGIWRHAGSRASRANGLDAAQGSFPFVAHDIDGQPRGESKDVGCDQVVDGTNESKLLKPAEVGPVWREAK